ncbi:MAG: hypothetical protein LPK88_07025 [Alphaproteobacteria bacterium]|nr:hypothetical protein [Alphaproteobacteria bacterium]
MTLANKLPLGLKQSRKRNPAHLARVAQLPCVICGSRPVEVHHVICGRYGQRRATDEDTIPLCYNHHRGPEGIHTIRAEWVARYGEDHEWLPHVRRWMEE